MLSTSLLSFVFFWVILRRLIYTCRRFGTLYLFHLQRHLPLKMEQIECSKTSAYINQTPGNHPKENKQHSEHGESLKLRIIIIIFKNILPSFTAQFVFKFINCVKVNFPYSFIIISFTI